MNIFHKRANCMNIFPKRVYCMNIFHKRANCMNTFPKRVYCMNIFLNRRLESNHLRKISQLGNFFPFMLEFAANGMHDSRENHNKIRIYYYY